MVEVAQLEPVFLIQLGMLLEAFPPRPRRTLAPVRFRLAKPPGRERTARLVLCPALYGDVIANRSGTIGVLELLEQVAAFRVLAELI